MGLPIPDILQNASNVIKEAKSLAKIYHDLPEFSELKGALKKINEEDLTAVMNEVGQVYVTMHNMQVTQVGARANKEKKTMEFITVVDFGLGPRNLVCGLPIAQAADFVKNLNNDLAQLTGTEPGSKLITQVG